MGAKRHILNFMYQIEDIEDELVFYKSNKSDRWWLDVKYTSTENNLYERHCMVPCSKLDYENALTNAIPDLWWKTLQKLN